MRAAEEMLLCNLVFNSSTRFKYQFQLNLLGPHELSYAADQITRKM